jgi:hypothetical protein
MEDSRDLWSCTDFPIERGKGVWACGFSMEDREIIDLVRNKISIDAKFSIFIIFSLF